MELPGTPGDLLFHAFCSILDNIAKTYKSKDKLALLQPIWVHYKTHNLYNIMRLLIPAFDMQRQVYGAKEVGIAKLYIAALGLSDKTSKDAQRLKDWKKPIPLQGRGATVFGDFTTVLYDVLRSRCTKESDKTIDQVNELLEEVTLATDLESRKRIWMKIISEYSAREQMWLMRIMLKELKIGVRQETILKHFHPQASEVYNSSADLRQVCEFVLDPKTQSHFLQIQLFKPVRVMLAAVVDWDKIIHVFKGIRFGIEIKFDGERIQIHKKGTELKFFTRNSKDFTNQHGYRDVMGPIINANVEAQSCILDGELVTWNQLTQNYGPFGMNRTISKRQLAGTQTMEDGDADEIEGVEMEHEHLCYIVFDLLYYNGEIIMHKSLKERRTILESIVRPVPHVLEVSESYTDANSTEEIMDRLDLVLDKQLEGLVIKSLDSPYLPNERHGGWIKLKPEYVEGMSDTLDLIILGGYYGKGRMRSGKLSQFLMGIADKPVDNSEFPSRFYAFCKVGTGLSAAELDRVLDILNPHWIKYSRDQDFEYMQKWRPAKDDIPDAIIDHPKNSIILELLAGGIQRNTKFPAGCTLRFPRVKNVRYTKAWNDCCTINGKFLFSLTNLILTFCVSAEVMELLQRSERMHTKSGKRNRQEGSQVSKGKRGAHNTAASVSDLFLGAKVEGLKVQSGIFDGLEFYVVSGDSEFSKGDLEVLIKQNGGEFVQNALESTNFIVVGDLSKLSILLWTAYANLLDTALKARNLISAEKHSIINLHWIIDSIAASNRQILTPKYVRFLTPQDKSQLSSLLDPFGDFYEEDATPESLKEAMAEVAKQESFHLIDVHSVEGKEQLRRSLECEEYEFIESSMH